MNLRKRGRVFHHARITLLKGLLTRPKKEMEERHQHCRGEDRGQYKYIHTIRLVPQKAAKDGTLWDRQKSWNSHCL